MKQMILTVVILAAALAAHADGKNAIVPVPDATDYWKVTKYCEDAGRAYLLETGRVLSLLDAAMRVEENGKFPDRIFKLRERIARIKLITGKDKDLKAATDRYLAVIAADDPQFAKDEQKQAEYAVAQLRFLAMVRHGGNEQLPVFVDPRPQMKAIRDRLVTNERVQNEYVEQTISYMTRMYGPHGWGDDGMDWLDESCSFEAQVEFLRGELARPGAPGADFAKDCLARAYERLEQFDLAEKTYRELVASTNLKTSCYAQMNFGKYWERRAKRFYSPSWKPFLKNAVVCFSELYKHERETHCWPHLTAFRDWIVVDAMELKDYALVEKTLDLRTDKNGIRKDELYFWYKGQVAWAREDLDGTIEYLSQYPVAKVNKDNFAQYANLARAYDLKGEYEKELAVVEVLRKKGTGSWKDYYAYVADNLKKKMEK